MDEQLAGNMEYNKGESGLFLYRTGRLTKNSARTHDRHQKCTEESERVPREKLLDDAHPAVRQ